jgi:signal transduction histidine kinase/DNA-binding response OmpR family regulator
MKAPNSLRWRMTWLIVGGSLVSAVIATAGFSWRDFNQRSRYTSSEVLTVGNIIAEQVGPAVTLGDKKAAEEILNSLRSDAGIVQAILYDVHGKCFASYSRSAVTVCQGIAVMVEPAETNTFVLSRNVSAGGEPVGRLVLTGTTASLLGVLRPYLSGAILIVLVSIGVAGVLAVVLQSRVSAPILAISRVAQHIAQTHSFHDRVGMDSVDELGVLAGSFNAMLDEIERRDEQLATHRHELEDQVIERTRVNEELNVAKDRAEEATRMKSRFLANMSHEIRTPLNGIIGMTQLASQSDSFAEQQEYLAIVKLSAESLLTVINDILDFSKIEAGRLVIDTVEFDLRRVVDRTLKTLGMRANEKRLDLLCDIRPEVPAAFVGDPNRLQQILVNLAGNAIKFTETGEVVVEVGLVSQSATEVMLHFQVKDTGMGVPADKLKSIFEPFVQADGSITRLHGGTGLGLAICAQLVLAMGGRIWIESLEGCGSTFHFSLPFECPKSGWTSGGRRPSTALHGRRVLIVDESLTSLRLLEEQFARWQMVSVSARSGLEARSLVERTSKTGPLYDVALIDSQMTGMDAFALAAEFKSQRRHAIDVVMLLGSRDLNSGTVRCRELGISSYLTKPFSEVELQDATLEALGSSPALNVSAAPDVGYKIDSLSILLAEDNPVNQKLLLRLLEKAGHAVTLANDGAIAVGAFERGGFDLVLMDVQMPYMDGLQATQKIRAIEAQRGGHTPILALTAHAMKEDRDRCIQAGMDDYLSKPIYIPELNAVIARLTTGRSREKESQPELAG